MNNKIVSRLFFVLIYSSFYITNGETKAQCPVSTKIDDKFLAEPKNVDCEVGCYSAIITLHTNLKSSVQKQELKHCKSTVDVKMLEFLNFDSIPKIVPKLSEMPDDYLSADLPTSAHTMFQLPIEHIINLSKCNSVYNVTVTANNYYEVDLKCTNGSVSPYLQTHSIIFALLIPFVVLLAN